MAEIRAHLMLGKDRACLRPLGLEVFGTRADEYCAAPGGSVDAGGGGVGAGGDDDDG